MSLSPPLIIPVADPGELAAAPSTGAHLTPLHTAVAGRARFKLRALHRCESLQPRIEKRLRRVAGVCAAQANARTGNVLIYFEPSLPLEDLQSRLEQALTELSLPRPLLARTPHKPGWLETLVDSFQPRCVPVAENAPQPAPATGRTEPTWHALAIQDVMTRLDSAATGLDSAQAARRLATVGANVLPEAGRRSDLSMLLEQFASPPVAMLGVSAAVSTLTGGLLDAAVIGAVVVINALIGFATERQSEMIIAGLTPTLSASITALRDGRAQPVEAATLIPGDVVLLPPGCLAPADLRLLQAERLSVDESALTGESMPVEKQAERPCPADAPLAERHTMIYRGTLITGGGGVGMVVGTGLNTEIGRIQALAEQARPPATVVERQLDEMGRQVVWLSSAVCGLVFVVGLLRGQGWLPMLKASISLGVAAVPEGLPTVATTTLAIGIRDMRKRNVLVRRLNAVETLGSVQVFCLDKTGTLTLNRMTVMALHVGLRRIVVDDSGARLAEAADDPTAAPEFRRLLEVVILCSEVQTNGDKARRRLDGSATELALAELALRHGLDIEATRTRYPRLRLQHRAEDRPYMVTVHTTATRRRLTAVKGSPEQVLALCDRYMQDGAAHPLDDATRAAILWENSRMAGAALRVLGVAFAERGGNKKSLDGLVWLGLAGLADPLRPGMAELLRRFHRAGIATAMITGDQSATAYAIAKELDLADGRPMEILDSVSLDKIDPELLSGVIRDVQVFARVSPAHKLQIVQALQQSGKIVAMTGDGVNDGPALKAADLGVAMGDGGTDVARSVADVVLQDDDLTTMIVAVRDGRTIYSNIRKAVRYLLSTNLSEITVMLGGVGLGLGQPLNPMQLLWINLVTDIFPALALALEPPEPDILEQPPRDPETPIVGPRDLRRLALESAFLSGGALGAYGYGLLRYGQGPQAGAHAFMTLTLGQLLHALSSRSEEHTLFESGSRPPNPYLKWALGGSLAAQALTLLLPGLRRVLGVTPLTLLDSLVIAAGAGAPLLLSELTKPTPHGSAGAAATGQLP